jgi:AcrR family transcriptional regulator
VTRRRLTPDQRRGELLEAALGVLRQQGPTDCRVEDITAEAGTAKGNFYRYFPTWDDLLVAVRDHLMDGYADGIRRRSAVNGRVDWWKVLEEEADRFVEFQLGLGGLHDVVFHGPASQSQPIDGQRSAAGLMATLLSAGVADGAFADIDVSATATLLFAMLHAAADQIRVGADPDDMRSAVLFVLTRTLAPARVDMINPARTTAWVKRSGPAPSTADSTGRSSLARSPATRRTVTDPRTP